MKTAASVLLLAAATSALVSPDPNVFGSLETQPRTPPHHGFESLNELKGVFQHVKEEVEEAFHHVESSYDHYSAQAKDSLDEAFAYVEDTTASVTGRIQDSYFDAQAWLDSTKEAWEEEVDISTLGHHHHDSKPPHHRPPPHHGHHGHHGPFNLTVYQLIAGSKYTSKLAELINKYDDLVEALNSTVANFTVFAPTNRAFEKIPKHAPEPSKELLKAVLAYHVSPEFYPAGRILVSRTVPTLLNSSALGNTPLPQRLSTNIGLKGLTVNFYSRIIAVDVFGTNGVVHGVDSLLIPPPSILKIIDLLPSEFSTLELGLGKTGLFDELNKTTQHAGGTFFAPSNFAFQKLGPGINAFLFSSRGLKYLKALLQYHVVAGRTLYSDAYYDGEASNKTIASTTNGIPKGLYHVDLPTLLEDRSLSIDIARYGRLIDIKINSFTRVSIADGVAYDGVLHVLSSVLIPPKKLPGGDLEMWNGSDELTVDDLKQRLEPLVKQSYSDDL